MLLKIAPDLREDELEDIAAACAGGAVDGIIVSNTTLSREGLRSPLAGEQGGLSGQAAAGALDAAAGAASSAHAGRDPAGRGGRRS